jgi:hypothetical protein
MVAVIDAKRLEFMDELDIVDACDLMDPDSKKWERISDLVMQVGFSPCLRDGPMMHDYCLIADYHARSGMNWQAYWK